MGDDSTERHPRLLKLDRALALLLPHVFFCGVVAAGAAEQFKLMVSLFVGAWGGVLALSILVWREQRRLLTR